MAVCDVSPKAECRAPLAPANYSLMLYFFLNLSMRPAVSTSFCLPVKKGWQDEQISTFMSFIVERVSITLPQAQVILVISYFGCIPSLI